MDSKEILRKAALLKRNPQLANVIPNSEIIALLSDVLTAFSTLQKAVESNKLKGDKGERGDDAIAPIAGQDYPSFEQVDTYLSQAVKNFTDEYTKFQKEAKAVIERASKLENGKDAEITEELVEEIAENAFSLIELPDFDELVDTRITASPQAIRDALELLQGDERLDASAIKGLERFIKTVQVNGGTIGKGQVYGFIQQAVADGTIPTGSGSGITRTIVLTSGNVTMASTASVDYVYVVTGNHTVTLPTAVGNENQYTVRNNHSSNITINTTSSQDIKGAVTGTSYSLFSGDARSFISDGTAWNIV